MKNSKKTFRNRSLHIESLENREMLSVNPLMMVYTEDTSAAFTASAPESAAAATASANYNSYEWGLIQSQGLARYARWRNGRLVELSADEARLTGDLDLSGCTELRELDCSENRLTSLNVSGCTNLRELDCSENRLTSLDISGCTNLQELDCDRNQLMFLDVSESWNLRELDCTRNQLMSLDVSGFPNLRELDCTNNQLTSLDVSGCTNLRELECANNQLTSLDVSGCTNLRELECYYNQLDSLDLSGTPFDGYRTVEQKIVYGLNSVYRYNYRAFDNSRCSLLADEYTQVTDGAPGYEISVEAPTNLKAAPSANRNVNLTWTAVPGATAYQIYWKLPNGTEKLLKTTTNTRYTTERFSVGEHTFYVYALAGSVKSTPAAVTTTIAAPVTPAAPTNLKAAPLASRNVNLTWTAVPGATHYQIYWKNAKGKMVGFGTTKATSFKTTRVPNGVNTFYVYAWTDKLRSTKFATVTTTVGTKTTAPAAPTNFKAAPLASRNVNLTWTAVPGATHYQIFWRNAKGKMVGFGTTEKTSFKTTRVPNGSNTFYVYAWTDKLRSTSCATVTTMVTTMVGTKTTAPAAPTNFKAMPLASRNVNLTWDAVPGATHYQIYWKNAKGKMVGFGTTEKTSFKTTRVPNGSNTFYVYAWTDKLRSTSFATVTTTVKQQ